jgi:hypothetical protein
MSPVWNRTDKGEVVGKELGGELGDENVVHAFDGVEDDWEVY